MSGDFIQKEEAMTEKKRLPVSCIYIVKDEELFLAASLESICDFVSELLIYDSGSQDNTLEIAQSFSQRVPQFKIEKIKWPDDFSAARNQAARAATQPWILFVDGDEVLDNQAAAEISVAISQEKIACYSLLQRNYSQESSLDNASAAQPPYPGLILDAPLYFVDNWMERLYKNGLGIEYRGKIHESLVDSCREKKLETARLNLTLHHYGRLKAERAKKLEYYLQLSQDKIKESPQDPAAWIELAITWAELGNFEKSFEVCIQAVQEFPSEPETLKVAFQLALRTERYAQAEKWIRAYRALRSEDLYALSQLTTALLYQGRFEDTLKTAAEVFSHDPEDFVSHINCGVIFYEKQDWRNALRHLEAAQQARPHDIFVSESLKKVRTHIQSH